MPAATPIWLRLVGGLAVAWNALGVLSYLQHVGLVLGPMPPAANMPVLVTAAYAIGVFGGITGALGLLLARRWTVPLLWLSLAGLVVDWGWVFAIDKRGSVPLGIAVLSIAAALAFLATYASRRGWLR